MLETMTKTLFAFLFCLSFSVVATAENGYRLWLRYDKLKDEAALKAYRQQINYCLVEGSSPTLNAAKEELQIGLVGLLDKPQLPWQKLISGHGIVAGGAGPFADN